MRALLQFFTSLWDDFTYFIDDGEYRRHYEEDSRAKRNAE